MPIFEVSQRMKATVLVVAETAEKARKIAEQTSYSQWDIEPVNEGNLNVEDVSEFCDEEDCINAPDDASVG